MSDFEYVGNISLADLSADLRDPAHERIAITTHAKPDGDAIGSTLALYRALTRVGREVDCFLMGPIEPAMSAVIGDTPIIHITEDGDINPSDDYHRIIVVDTGAWSQLSPLADWLRPHHARIVGIDHHARGDDVAARRYIDVAAASTTQIVLELFDAMHLDLDTELAEPLFVGLATDTGWFRHSNGDARAFAAAARLLAAGVDKARLYQTIEETHRPARLGLLARAMSSLEFIGDHAVAVMTLTPDDFTESGGTVSDLTGLVNQPMDVGSVRMSVLITATESGRTKISFRSKPAITDNGAFFNVNEIARTFGGGGHVHAAGASVDEDLAEVRPRVIATLQNAVG